MPLINGISHCPFISTRYSTAYMAKTATDNPSADLCYFAWLHRENVKFTQSLNVHFVNLKDFDKA
jgi:hypothetical protein